jgi:hypothetical protein
MTVINKQLLISESRGNSNRCTPCRGKFNQHAILPPRLICVWSRTIHLTWSAYDNFSLVPTKSKQAPTPGRSLDNQRQTDTTIILSGFILPPMRQPWSRGEMFRPSGYTATSVYWAHKHQYMISTFNTYSWGPTNWSLTDIGGGYNLRGAGLPHTTLQSSQPAVSTFHLRTPLGLQFNRVPSTKPKC